MTTNAPELREINLNAIRASGHNPRKDFTSPAVNTYLAGLAETIKRQGILQPALVRPEYCLGARSSAEIVSKRPPALPPGGFGNVVLIAGECRWRASKLANRATLPCVVREMTDDDAREAQQIENLQRQDLTALEEAQGFDEMLTLKDDAGKPRYTVASLAERIGRPLDYVYRRRALLQLPAAAKAAILDGTLSPRVASLISTIPVVDLREKFTQKVLKPQLTEGPLTFVEARRVRDESFVQTLKGAPFNLDDAALDPVAGPCSACPKMSANAAHLFDPADATANLKGRTCLDPNCYRGKLAAVYKRQDEAAKKEGKRMLSIEETSAIYPAAYISAGMAPTAPYVEIARRPDDHLLKKEVANSARVQSWAQLVEEAERKTGGKVPRILARDQSHVVRELVDVKAAMALIEKSGEPIFKTAGERAPGDTVTAAARLERKAEQEEAKHRAAAILDGLTALEAALAKGWDKPATWDVIFDLALGQAGPDGWGLIAKWKGLASDGGTFGNMDAVQKWSNGLKQQQRDNLVPILLLAPHLKHNGLKLPAFVKLAGEYKIDAKAIEKAVREKAKLSKKPEKLTGPALEEKVRELRRAKKSGTEISLALGISLPRVAILVKKIEAAEQAAKVTTDPKILGEWVKAHAGGMSIDEIARSYKVPKADVQGALQGNTVKAAKGKGGPVASKFDARFKPAKKAGAK